ncbi:MAG: glycosyltransferase, partial [Gammaproteobacteria bacterium]|nr:glycosyltransferase [Gammaproteobacteria bacterium]
MDNVIKTGNVIRSGLIQAREKLHSKITGFAPKKYSNGPEFNDIISTGHDPESCKKAAVPPASIAILLCTYNGDRFLRDQLESLRSQRHQNLTLHVSDDGSQDGTHLLLKRFQSELGDECVSVKSHPNLGVVKNFLSLVCQSEIKADYYAYADQDDVWEADKLTR